MPVVALDPLRAAELVRQRTQLVRDQDHDLDGDFDAIQPVITDECLEHPRREDVLAASPPRWRSRQAARLVYQVFRDPLRIV